MKTLKEKKLLVRMQQRIGEPVDQKLLDEIAEEEAKIQQVAESRRNAFQSMFAGLSNDIGKLMADEKKKTAEEQAILDRFASTLSKIDEIKAAQSISEQPQVTIPEEVADGQLEKVLDEIVEEVELTEKSAILAPIEEPTLAKEAAKKISKEAPPSVFVQPEPAATGRDLADIQRKLKLLEGWVSKISMTGPGGGAVWLKDLDDVARSSVIGAADGDVLTYNASTKKWIANPITITANGVVGTLDQVTTAGNTTNNNIIVGDVLPSTNLMYSLGSDTQRWESLWVGANSITFSDTLGGPDQVLSLSNQVFYITQGGGSNTTFNANAGFNAGGIILQNYTMQLANTTQDLVIGSASVDTSVIINQNLLVNATITFSDMTTQNTAATQADWTEANTSKLSFIKNKPTIPDIGPIEEALIVSGEPMGHDDKTQSSISFNESTRTFTIAPVGASFDVWVTGTKHTFTTAQTVTIPDTTGLYYIYFDENGLGVQADYFTWESQAPTALLYWNGVTNKAPYFADERHGTTLDWQTHEYLHRTRGAVIAQGFAIGNYTIGGSVQCDIGNGTFFDEDLQVDVVHSNTPVINTWQQDLQGPAQIPMFYLSGTSWVRDEPTNYPVKQGVSRQQYNLLSGGTWSTADIDSNKYGATFIIATNNLTYPVIGIMSQSAHANLGDAEALDFGDLVLTGFPVAEFRLLYKLVFKANTSHGQLASVWDLRGLSLVTSIAAVGTDHGLLSGLSDNDHPQYQLVANLATDVATLTSNNTSFVGTVSAANVVSNSQLSSNLANYQTTTGLSANVATLSSNNSLYLGTVAANQYAYANGSNFSINNPVTVTYTPATANGAALTATGKDTQGGIGYFDFLKVTNTTSGVTNGNKTFRLSSAGAVEIINSTYTAPLVILSDAGNMSISGDYQVNGKKAVNGPAFSAYPTSPAQTIASGSNTRVNLGNEEYDIGGCYDAPNGKFQPNVEGYYQLNATVRIDGSSGTGERMIVIYKNGAEHKRGTNEMGTEAGANFFTLSVSCIAYANGSGDYFQVYVYQSSGANRTISEYQQISYFQGCMIRGA